MVSLTLSVPEELKREMDQFQEINWSFVAREAILRKIKLLNEMNLLLKNSQLTEDDALELGKKLNRKVAKKYFSSK